MKSSNQLLFRIRIYTKYIANKMKSSNQLLFRIRIHTKYVANISFFSFFIKNSGHFFTKSHLILEKLDILVRRRIQGIYESCGSRSGTLVIKRYRIKRRKGTGPCSECRYGTVTNEMWCGDFKIWVNIFRVTVTPKSHLEKHSVFQGVPGSSFHGGVSRHFYST
jgi:hypothetical protein